MSPVTHLSCVRCGRHVVAGRAWTCPACGPADGILDIHYDLDRARRTLTRDTLSRRPLTHWRYRELLPIDDAFIPDTPIGWTPVIEAPRLAAALGVRRIRLKDDGRNASASFKDRASSVGVAHALQTGFREIACASTGNAASSLAHCAAAAGLACNIFVPQMVPEGKLAQLLAYGARVFKVRGTYAQAYDLCTQACERFGWYNRNCAVNPYLVEGKKTGGLEAAEQIADDPPDWVAVSVGDGCTIAGIFKGIEQARAVGLTGWSARMLGVQAAGVAPIAELGRALWCRYSAGEKEPGVTGRKPVTQDTGYKPVPQDLKLPACNGTTYADSINCPVPRNWRKALAAVHGSGGAWGTVSDEQIMEAVRETGRLSGVFAEPAAAAVVAGVAEARRAGTLGGDADVLIFMTGNGLKDTAGALRAVGQPHDVLPELADVARIVESEAHR